MLSHSEISDHLLTGECDDLHTLCFDAMPKMLSTVIRCEKCALLIKTNDRRVWVSKMQCTFQHLIINSNNSHKIRTWPQCSCLYSICYGQEMANGVHTRRVGANFTLKCQLIRCKIQYTLTISETTE